MLSGNFCEKHKILAKWTRIYSGDGSLNLTAKFFYCFERDIGDSHIRRDERREGRWQLRFNRQTLHVIRE